MKFSLSSLLNALRAAAKRLFKVAAKKVAATAIELLNDPELQSIARDCVAAVAESGLKDNAALDEAVRLYKERAAALAKAKGAEILRDSFARALIDLTVYLKKWSE